MCIRDSNNALAAQVAIEAFNRFRRARTVQGQTAGPKERSCPGCCADDIVVGGAVGVCLHFGALDNRETGQRVRIDIRPSVGSLGGGDAAEPELSLIHISEPTRLLS